MAAAVATRVLEVKDSIIRQSLLDFQNVEHRLEHVINVHGIEFINDRYLSINFPSKEYKLILGPILGTSLLTGNPYPNSPTYNLFSKIVTVQGLCILTI